MVRRPVVEIKASMARKKPEVALAIPEQVAVPAQRGVALELSREQQDILVAWLEAKSPDTVRCYKQWLAKFVSWVRAKRVVEVSAEMLDGDVVIALVQMGVAKTNWLLQRWVKAQVEAGVPRTTYAKHYAAFRSFCTTLRDAELIDFVPAAKLPAAEPRSAMETQSKYGEVPASYKALVKALEKLATAEDAEAIDVRDWAILRLGRGLGLRRVEIYRLDVADVQFDKKTVSILGKGRKKQTLVPLPKSLVPVLKAWLAARTEAVGRKTGPLFVTLSLHVEDRRERLARGSINTMVTRRAKRLGIELRPHDLRRIFCTRAIEKFGLNRAKALSRHKNVATLEIYDLAQGRELARMAEEAAEEDED